MRQYAQAYRNDLEFAVDGMKTTINGMAGIDGRKVFVYISEGLPAQVGVELYDVVQRKYREGANTLSQFEFDMNSRYTGIVAGGQRAGRHRSGRSTRRA